MPSDGKNSNGIYSVKLGKICMYTTILTVLLFLLKFDDSNTFSCVNFVCKTITNYTNDFVNARIFLHELFPLREMAASSIEVCDIHQTNPATEWCSQCEQSLCRM